MEGGDHLKIAKLLPQFGLKLRIWSSSACSWSESGAGGGPGRNWPPDSNTQVPRRNRCIVNSDREQSHATLTVRGTRQGGHRAARGCKLTHVICSYLLPTVTL